MATTKMTIARAASSIMTSLRRSSRSMMTPVKGNISMAGRVWSTAKVPSAISEWVAWRMYQATAAEFIPLPNIETTLATKTQRRERSRRTENIIPDSNMCCERDVEGRDVEILLTTFAGE